MNNTMAEIVYLNKLDYVYLEMITKVIDKHGYMPNPKEIAADLHIKLGLVYSILRRLRRAEVLVRDDKKRWHLLVRPKDFKDNLKKEMMKNE